MSNNKTDQSGRRRFDFAAPDEGDTLARPGGGTPLGGDGLRTSHGDDAGYEHDGDLLAALEPVEPPLVRPEALVEHDHVMIAATKARAPWRRLMVDATAARAGENVLDIGCGVGELTLDLLKAAPDGTSITGLEADPQLLKVAQQQSNGVVWRFGDIADGVFEGADFDVATCAFSLGRFTDPEDALAATRTALKPGGRIIIAAWSAGPEDSVRRVVLDLLSRHSSPDVINSYASQFSLGSAKALGSAANAAGFNDILLQRRRETVKFDSLDAFIDVELKQMPLADKVNPVQRAGLMAEARNRLHRRIKRDGRFVAALDAVLLSARRL